MNIKRQLLKKLMSINPSTRMWILFWKYRHLIDGNKWIMDYNDLNHPHRQKLIEIIGKQYPFHNILEIGCGLGSNLYLLSKKFPNAQLYGIDINSQIIKEGKKLLEQNKIKNITLKVGNALNIDYPNKYFDIVFSDACFLCISPNQIEIIVNEINRLSKKAIILNEYHSSQINRYQKYKVYWVYNYKQFFPNLIEYKITHDLWNSEGWEKHGYIMEIKK